MSLCSAKYFGTFAELLVNLRSRYNLEVTKDKVLVKFEQGIRPYAA